MINGLLGLAGVAGILFLAELLTKKKVFKGETARKFVHIATGCFIATWPYFMTFRVIQAMCLAMLLVVYVSRSLGIFRSIHKVKRSTRGELFFPVGIGLAAAMADAPWIFAIAVLQLALADGLAAIIGLKWGLKHKYRIFGFLKTYLGSATFFVVSTIVILTVFFLQNDVAINSITLPLTLSLSLLLTAIESLAVQGLDNLLIPVVTVIALNVLA